MDDLSPRSAHFDEVLTQTLSDPVFEPQPGFKFADSHSKEQRSLHQTVGSPLDPPQDPNRQFFDHVSTFR